MPSKKEARGKARRVAKNVMGEDGTKIQRLKKISNNSNNKDEDALLEEAINLAAVEREELETAAKNDKVNNSEECHHGLPKGHVCAGFMESFDNVCAAFSKLNLTAGDLFKNAYEATKTKYANVWNDPDKLKWVVSNYLTRGTDWILEGEYAVACLAAMHVSFFEQWMAIKEYTNNEAQASWNLCDWGKISELYKGDEHTLVSFFRKRIPCKCLDEKLKEVKSITKIGICQNPSFSLPDSMTARSKMLYCTQCRRANYCSIACQEADWPSHKKYCAVDARRLAALKSRQKE